MTQPFSLDPADPQINDEWELWYIDTFDREFPPRVDVRGRGLLGGLTQLWARHMFETVRPEGRTGFSSFYLKLKHGRVEISGDRAGADRLREWLYGKKETSYKGYVAEADIALLEKVAAAHLHILGKGQKAAEILAVAKTANDAADFTNRLNDLLKK